MEKSCFVIIAVPGRAGFLKLFAHTFVVCLLGGISSAWADYPVYELESSGIVYDGALGAHLPGVTRAANGDLLVQFNTATDGWEGGIAYFIRSTDNGQTWGAPVKLAESFSSGGSISTTIGITLLQNGDIVFPYTEIKLRSGATSTHHPGVEWAYTYTIVSHDNGYTWQPRQLVSTDQAGAFGQIVEMSNGDLLLPEWAFNYWGGNFDDGGRKSWVRVSHDGGQTWPDKHYIGPTGENSVERLSDGTLLSLGKIGAYSSSVNGGQSWVPLPKTWAGGKNASLHTSPNGFLITFYSVGTDGLLAYSTNSGAKWFQGPTIKPAAPSVQPYGLTAVNLDSERMMIFYQAVNPLRTELGNSPWDTTTTVIGYTIVRERRIVGEPLAAPLEFPRQPDQPTITTVAKHVYAYPCPWRSDRDSGRVIVFKGVTDGKSIRIYTIAAELVRELRSTGEKTEWDLTNGSGERVASGIYLYVADGARGKLAIIR